MLRMGEVFSNQYSFLNQLDVEALPELKLQIRTENRRSHIEWVERPVHILSERILMLPSILTSIPYEVQEGENTIQILVEDDGEIIESSIWLDGEKKGWKEGDTSWDIPLELSLGRHQIRIQTKDDTGLKSHKLFYVDAVSAP